MNVETTKMAEYAAFLDENSRKIIALCTEIEGCLAVAIQCMDQQSGRGAALRMEKNMDNIKRNVPISDDASKRLVLAKKYIDSAGTVFGR